MGKDKFKVKVKSNGKIAFIFIRQVQEQDERTISLTIRRNNTIACVYYEKK